MPEELRPKAERIIRELETKGRHAEAQHVKGALEASGDRVLFLLREACQTVLTAVESLDPYTNTLVEELRQEVDKRMTRA